MRTLRIILVLTLAAISSQASLADGVNDHKDMDTVPSTLIDTTLSGYVNELDGVGLPAPDGGLPPKQRNALLATAKDLGLDAAVANQILEMLSHRVELARRDLAAANLAPALISLRRHRQFNTVVYYQDLRKLQAAKADLDAYFSQLSKLQATEWDLMQKQFVVGLNRALTQLQLAQAYAANPPFGGSNPQLDKAVAAATTTLNSLNTQWDQIAAQDARLAQGYVRKTFLSPIPSPSSSGNRVKVLIDAEQYYNQLATDLQDVAAAGKDGVVQIALWDCDVSMPIGGGKSFYQAIQQVVQAGGRVQVLLWAGSKRAFPAVQEDNNTCRDKITALGSAAEVYLVDSDLYKGSHHDKYFILHDATHTRALVGGLNIDRGNLDLTVPKLAGPPHQGAGGSSWVDVHDVGVEIEGVAVVDVKRDFDVRWFKTGGKRIEYTPVATGEGGTNDVAIATTRDAVGGMGSPKLEDIRDALMERVSAANQFIYVENYAVLDEGFVKAIGQRVAQQRALGNPFNVIILIHKDWPSPATTTTYGWLHRITYLALSFTVCTSFTYVDADGHTHTVNRSPDDDYWRIGPYSGDFNQDTMAIWSGGSTKLTSITSFSNDLPLYYLAYNNGASNIPIWVHSKVAVFDDTDAVVGSANFNVRSLSIDNELDAVIHGQAAHDLRSELWAEYWGAASMPTPSGWGAAVDKLASSVPANQEVILPLHLADFPNDLDAIRKRIANSQWGLLKRFVLDASWY